MGGVVLLTCTVVRQFMFFFIFFYFGDSRMIVCVSACFLLSVYYYYLLFYYYNENILNHHLHVFFVYPTKRPAGVLTKEEFCCQTWMKTVEILLGSMNPSSRVAMIDMVLQMANQVKKNT